MHTISRHICVYIRCIHTLLACCLHTRRTAHTRQSDTQHWLTAAARPCGQRHSRQPQPGPCVLGCNTWQTGNGKIPDFQFSCRLRLAAARPHVQSARHTSHPETPTHSLHAFRISELTNLKPEHQNPSHGLTFCVTTEEFRLFRPAYLP